MDHTLIGQVAGVLALVQILPYIVSIVRGRTKPERASYLIWLIVDIVGIASYIAVGAHSTIWAGLVFCLTGLIVFLLSIKRGIGGFSHFDVACLVISLAAVLIWIFSKNALIALALSTFVNFIGYLPTIKKVYFLPNTENTFSWSIAAIASTLNILALTSLRPQFALPIFMTAGLQLVVTFLLLFPTVRIAHSPHPIHRFLMHPVFVR